MISILSILFYFYCLTYYCNCFSFIDKAVEFFNILDLSKDNTIDLFEIVTYHDIVHPETMKFLKENKSDRVLQGFLKPFKKFISQRDENNDGFISLSEVMK
jgi:hypothetical protein